MPPAPLKVDIYSWDFQWIYWPMYCALADVQGRYHVEFEIKEPLPPSDRKILHEARIEWEQGDSNLSLALCEPDMEADAAHEIPLIWRLPHWLVRLTGPGTGEGTDKAPPRDSVRTYGAETTSGKFARKILDPGQIAATELKHHEYQDHIDSGQPAGEVNWAFTFTPFHCFDPVPTPAGGPTTVPGMVEQYAGVTQLASALIFPGQGLLDKHWKESNQLHARHGGLPAASLFEAVLTALARVLHELDFTQGRTDLLRAIVLREWEAVERLVGRHKIRPWLSRRDGKGVDHRLRLVPCLREYVLLGCYVPYSAVNRAFGPLITRAVDAEHRELVAKFSDGVRTRVDTALDHRQTWSELTFADRLAAHKTCEVSKPGERPTPTALWKYLTHDLKWKSEPKIRAAFDQVAFKLPSRGKRQLSNFVIDGEPVTHESYEQGGDYWAGQCGRPIKPGGGELHSPTPEHPGRPCALCRFSGFTRGVMMPGVQRLRAALSKKRTPDGPPVPPVESFSYEVSSDNSQPWESERDPPTPLCSEDLDGFFETFVAEMRDPERTNGAPARCDVLCCLDAPDEKRSDFPRGALIAILWNGKTNGNTNSGNMGDKIGEWAGKQAVGERAIDWAGRWHRKPDRETWTEVYPGRKDRPAARGGETTDAPPEGVIRLFRPPPNREYCFAYVAYYSFVALDLSRPGGNL